jgi:hypothetical protein
MKTKASPYVFIVPPSLSFSKEEESGGTRWRRKGVDVHHDVQGSEDGMLTSPRDAGRGVDLG